MSERADRKRPPMRVRVAVVSVVALIWALGFWHLARDLGAGVLLAKGLNLQRQGQHLAALLAASRGLTLEPDEPALLNLAGDASLRLAAAAKDPLEKKARMDAGLAFYEKSFDEAPRNVDAAFGAALALHGLEALERGQNPGAAPGRAGEFYEKALNLRPNAIQVRTAYLAYLHQSGRSDQIPPVARCLARAYPPAVSAALDGQPYFTDAVRTAVERGLAQALENADTKADALRELAALQEKRGAYPQAADRFGEYLEQEPEEAGALDLLRLGDLNLKAGRFSKAARAYDRALHKSPDPVFALERIYAAYQKAEALPRFLSFIESESGARAYPQADLFLGRAYFALGDLNRAEENLQKAVDRAQSHEAWFWLSLAFRRQNREGESIRALEKAVELNPSNARYRLVLSQRLDARGSRAAALLEADRAVALDPESSRLLLYRSGLKEKAGDLEGALADARAALERAPSDQSLADWAANLLMRLGRVDEARKLRAGVAPE